MKFLKSIAPTQQEFDALAAPAQDFVREVYFFGALGELILGYEVEASAGIADGGNEVSAELDGARLSCCCAPVALRRHENCGHSKTVRSTCSLVV